MKIWIVDWVGYDAMGGNAKAFSSFGAAKASLGWPDEGLYTAANGFVYENETASRSAMVEDVIYSVELDAPPIA